MLVAGRNTELCLLAATGDVHVVVVHGTELLHSIYPIGVVVPILVLAPGLVVIQLTDAGGGVRLLGGVVELLLHHHRVVVTVQQRVAIGLPCARELIRKVHARLATGTMLGGNQDNTIGTLRTPDGRSSGILQDLNISDVLNVHRQQRRVSLLVGVGKVEIFIGIVKNLVIDNDQRVSITIDGCHTTQAHRRSCTEVTRVGHDVQTGNLTLKGLVGRCKCQTFNIFHIQRLLRHSHLFLGNRQTAGAGALRLHNDLLQLGVLRVELHLEDGLVANGQHLRLVAHIGEHQFVLGTSHRQREVTVKVGLCGRHNTVVRIAFHDVTHHDGTVVVAQRTGDTHSLGHRTKADDAQQSGKQYFLNHHSLWPLEFVLFLQLLILPLCTGFGLA